MKYKMKKKIIISLVVILILVASLVGFLVHRRNAIVQIALNDAGLTRSQVYDVDVEREHGVYEVDFETWEREYHYIIDANTKEVLRTGFDY